MGLSLSTHKKTLDSYSLLIVSKYFEFKEDFINVMCVCKKFKKTTEKLRYNPISITSIKLFPKIQTQYLYSRRDKFIDGIERHEIWYIVNYNEYLSFKNNNIKCHFIKYLKQKENEFGNTIPNGVNIIGFSCFSGTNIKSIVIPNVVTSIENYAFCECSFLENIILSTRVKILDIGCFSGCISLINFQIPSTIISIKNNCFVNCSNLQTISIPNSVTMLGNNCFNSCISLQSIILPSSIIMLKKFTFNCCFSLSNIVFPTTITSFGSCCFKQCSSLTTINLPFSLLKLGKLCFSYCSNLVSVKGVNELIIGDGCFNSCPKLRIQPNTKMVV
ncbi:Leucine rich repeat containing protein BspA family protein [Entamoeba marina]